MKAIVIDASVAVKWLFQEPDHQHALNILQACEDHHTMLVAPDLLQVEVANALRKRVVRDQVGTQWVKEGFKKFLAVPIEYVATADVSGLAFELALELSVSVYDACYLALARNWGAPLVTADAALTRAVGRRQDLSVVLLGAPVQP